MEHLVHQETETEIFEYILDLPLLSQLMEQIDYHWDLYKFKSTSIFDEKFSKNHEESLLPMTW